MFQSNPNLKTMFFKFQRIFQRNFDPTCITCAIGPVFTLSSVCGGFSGTYKCEHANYSIFVSHFKSNRILLLWSMLITFFNTLAFCYYMHSILLNTNEKTAVLVQISDLLCTLISLTLCAYNINGYQRYVVFLNGWLNLFKCYSLCLELSSINKVKVVVFFVFVFATIMNLGVHLNYYLLDSKLDGTMFVIKKILSILNRLLEMCMLSNFIFVIWICRLSLKHSQELLIQRFLKSDQTLLRSIVRWRRLYHSFMSNFRYFLKLITPFFLFWFSNMLAQVILSIYGSLLTIYQNTYDRDIWIVQNRLAVFLVWILVMLVNLEFLANTSNEFMSFLFKFRVSALSQKEADQVEILIKTLIAQKPLLRVSDIFTIGLGLLAPISGMVVTYVLVALQFHVARPT